MNVFRPDDEMLRDYTQRKLSASEEERVELWLADHPDVVRQLEFDLALQNAVGDIRPEASIEAQRRPSQWIGWLSRPVLAAAALVLLSGNIVLSIALLNRTPSPALGSALVVDLVHFRGEEEPFALSTGVHSDLVLRMFPAIDDRGPFTIELSRPDARSIKSGELRPDREGVVAARVNTVALVPGMWTVTLRKGEKKVSDFQLRVDE